MDDIVITEDTAQGVTELKLYVQKFQTKNLGQLHFFGRWDRKIEERNLSLNKNTCWICFQKLVC